MPGESSKPPIRKGPVKVTGEGFLQGRVGDVQGFMEAGRRRLCLVTWPDGGTTFFAEDALTQPPGGPKRMKL